MATIVSAEMYGVGEECTWHGPLTFAALPESSDDIAVWACPSCGRPLKVTTVEHFWQEVAIAEKQRPGYLDLMTWSEAKCYPDFDTLENVYRQAMEGTL